jgi:hypothetical protein
MRWIHGKSGFLLKLISELPNMFLSKMSFLDSVEHDPKQLFHACIKPNRKKRMLLKY